MPIIRMGSASDVNEGTFIDGAYSPLEWKNDEAVSIGNSDIKLRESRHAMFLYSTHHGLCIMERERNMHDDSDFYMTIWDPEAQAPYEILFATTRGWSYPCYGSRADATPEVMAEYEAWRVREWKRSEERAEASSRRQTVINCLHLIHKGATCKVARGRKIAKGTTGVVLGFTEKPDYMGLGMETWALLDVGTGFVSVLSKHLDVVTRSPEALQLAFDTAEGT